MQAANLLPALAVGLLAVAVFSFKSVWDAKKNALTSGSALNHAKMKRSKAVGFGALAGLGFLLVILLADHPGTTTGTVNNSGGSSGGSGNGKPSTAEMKRYITEYCQSRWHSEAVTVNLKEPEAGTTNSIASTVSGEAVLKDRVIDVKVTIGGDAPYYKFEEHIPEEFTRAVDLYEKNDYTTAVPLLNQVISANHGKVAEAYQYRGDINAHLNNYEDGISDLTMAMQLGLTTAETYSKRSYCFYLKGRKKSSDFYPKGIADLDNAIRQEPGSYRYFLRGCIYREMGEYEKAIADQTEAIALNPRDGDAYHERFLAKRDRSGLFGKNDYHDDFQMAQKLGFKE
jgi:tetratricopeptide (TPR) repeat protein